MECNGNNIFLHFNGVLKVSFPIEKLLKSGYLAINDFFLCLQLGFKYYIPLAIAHNRNWPLAKSINVNAKAVPKAG